MTQYFKICHLRTNKAADSERDSQTKKHTKHHIFAPTAGTRCTILAKLCMVIELVEIIKKGEIIFRSNAVFFYRVPEKKFGLNDHARFLINNSVTCEANLKH